MQNIRIETEILPFNLSITYGTHDLLFSFCMALVGEHTVWWYETECAMLNATFSSVVSLFLVLSSISVPLTNWCSELNLLTCYTRLPLHSRAGQGFHNDAYPVCHAQKGGDGLTCSGVLFSLQLHVLMWSCIVYALWITCTCVVTSLEIALVLL